MLFTLHLELLVAPPLQLSLEMLTQSRPNMLLVGQNGCILSLVSDYGIFAESRVQASRQEMIADLCPMTKVAIFLPFLTDPFRARMNHFLIGNSGTLYALSSIHGK